MIGNLKKGEDKYLIYLSYDCFSLEGDPTSKEHASSNLFSDTYISVN